MGFHGLNAFANRLQLEIYVQDWHSGIVMPGVCTSRCVAVCLARGLGGVESLNSGAASNSAAFVASGLRPSGLDALRP